MQRMRFRHYRPRSTRAPLSARCLRTSFATSSSMSMGRWPMMADWTTWGWSANHSTSRLSIESWVMPARWRASSRRSRALGGELDADDDSAGNAAAGHVERSVLVRQHEVLNVVAGHVDDGVVERAHAAPAGGSPLVSLTSPLPLITLESNAAALRAAPSGVWIWLRTPLRSSMRTMRV